MKRVVVGLVIIIGVAVPVLLGTWGIFLFWHDVIGISNKRPDRNAEWMVLVTYLGAMILGVASFGLGDTVVKSAWWRRNELRVRETVARKRRELR